MTSPSNEPQVCKYCNKTITTYQQWFSGDCEGAESLDFHGTRAHDVPDYRELLGEPSAQELEGP